MWVCVCVSVSVFQCLYVSVSRSLSFSVSVCLNVCLSWQILFYLIDGIFPLSGFFVWIFFLSKSCFLLFVSDQLTYFPTSSFSFLTYISSLSFFITFCFSLSFILAFFSGVFLRHFLFQVFFCYTCRHSLQHMSHVWK